MSAPKQRPTGVKNPAATKYEGTPPPAAATNGVALWSAAAAFFGYLLAVGIFDLLNAGQWVEYLGALIAAVVTGGAVYSKERLDAAKKAKGPG